IRAANRAQAEQSNCRATFSGYFSALRDQVIILQGSITEQDAAAKLAAYRDGRLPDAQTLAAGAETVAKLGTALQAVNEVPNLGTAVKHGWVPTVAQRATVPDLPHRVPRCPESN